jgi:hypothetical protein
MLLQFYKLLIETRKVLVTFNQEFTDHVLILQCVALLVLRGRRATTVVVLIGLRIGIYISL